MCSVDCCCFLRCALDSDSRLALLSRWPTDLLRRLCRGDRADGLFPISLLPLPRGGHLPGRFCHRHVWLAGVRPLRRAAVHLLRKPGASGGCVLRIDVWLHHGRRLSNHRYRGEPQKRALLARPHSMVGRHGHHRLKRGHLAAIGRRWHAVV